jgi:DNA-binding response OmpR family regulator
MDHRPSEKGGQVGVLSKPFHLRDLVARVEALIRPARVQGL